MVIRFYLVYGKPSAEIDSRPRTIASRGPPDNAPPVWMGRGTVGAHVIFAVTAATNGRMSDDGYSTSTTGSALAAVYVDENGRPIPPPRASIAEH
jgi:hypothetical protein